MSYILTLAIGIAGTSFGIWFGWFLAKYKQEKFIIRGNLVIERTPGGNMATIDILEKNPDDLGNYETVALKVVHKGSQPLHVL